MKKNWTQDEIDYIRTAYAQGKREKVIAAELGRSEASVSKAITRYNIRHKRDYASLSRQTCLNINKISRSVRAGKRVRPYQTFNETPCNWVSADEVLRYLGEKSPDFVIRYRNLKPVYLFRNVEVSLAKVLLEANRIRIQERNPIFHLDEVTQ